MLAVMLANSELFNENASGCGQNWRSKNPPWAEKPVLKKGR